VKAIKELVYIVKHVLVDKSAIIFCFKILGIILGSHPTTRYRGPSKSPWVYGPPYWALYTIWETIFEDTRHTKHRYFS